MIHIKYIIINLLAALSYALMSILMQLGLEHTNEPTITFVRFFAAFLFLIPTYLVIGKPSLKTKVFHLHFLRGILGFSMFLLYTISLNYISVGNALALNSTYPFFIPIILLIIYKEKLKLSTIISISIAFIGVYLIINPTVQNFFNIGAFLALLSAIFSASANITIKSLRKSEGSFIITFYFFLLSTLFSFIYSLFYEFHISSDLILLLIGISLFSLLSQFLLSYVLKFLHPNVVSTIMCSSIAFSFLIEWLFFNQMPSLLAVFGATIIIVGCISLWKNQ